MSKLNLPPAKRERTPEHKLRAVFKTAIIDSGLSYNEIARRSGYSRSTVCYIMSDRHEGRLSTWSDILDAAGIEVGFRHKEAPNG